MGVVEMAKDEGQPAHPLESARCWAASSVSWLTPLARKAVKGELQASDVWQAPSGQNVDAALGSFKAAWEVEKRKRVPSVSRAMLRANAWRVLRAAFVLFLFMGAQLAQPLLIQGLIDVLNGKSEGVSGFWLAGALLLCSLASSVLVSEYFRQGFLLAVVSRTAAMGAIYEKAISMSMLARASGSTGQTTNLMAVDAEKFVMAAQSFNFLWASPLMILCCGVILAYRIGYAGYVGLMLLLATIPIQHLIAKRGGEVRVRAMACTDERMKFVTEVVQGIRVAKLYGWEQAIYQQVAATRRRECRTLCTSLFMKITVREGLLLMAPALALASIFAVKVWEEGKLELSQAIVTLGLLNTLRFPMNLLALAMASTQDCLVATRRIRSFLLQEETGERGRSSPDLPEEGEGETEEEKDSPSQAGATGAVCCWGPALPFRLRVPKCSLARGSKVALLGPVGSGKTSFLSMLLGEMKRLKGSCFLNGRVAYMAQSPWIQNASLRQNILFGLPLKDDLYDEVLSAAALQADLEALVDGDQTDIGERGINLSGGQKARVGLARCLYAAATGSVEVVMLDSPFAALDMLTAQAVAEGLLRLTKTCTLLCAMSSHTHLLPHFDQVLVMKGGELLGEGAPDELQRLLGYLPCSEKPVEAEAVDETQVSPSRGASSPKRSTTDAKKLMRKDTGASTFPLLALGKWLGGPGRPRRGFCIGGPICLIFLAGQASRVLADTTLTRWVAGQTDFSTPGTFLGVLLILLALRIGLCTLASFRAARLLHDSMFWRLLRAPVTTYFDVVTSGEICNKFSKDLELADVQLPELLTQFLSNSAQLLIIFGLTVVALPWFGFVIALLFLAFVVVAVRSGSLMRGLQRFESAARSPMYNSFAETLGGLQTIRAWGRQSAFHEKHMRVMGENLRFFHAVSMSEIWLTFRLELLTVALIGSFSFMAVALREAVDGNTVGLALVYAIQMTAMFQRCTKLAIVTGQMLTACERVLSFEQIPQEPDLAAPEDHKLHSWPQGAIEFQSVSTQYRDGGLVLKDVSFSVAAGTRVGVCGRSGAGKSSLVMALFRVIDPSAGSIAIDGVDIASVGLHVLRQNLSIIPQDSVVFSGSLRSNLDPFSRISEDSVLLDALRQVGLGSLVKEAGLEMTVAEHGGNLSQGQRQLLCIARAFVRETRIMILDEATSAVDEQTDALIKTLLQDRWSKGQQCTVLTVAHRLSTILDYDRILVLQKGEVVEFDTPRALLEHPGGHFAKMVNETRPEKSSEDASPAPGDQHAPTLSL